ncbi:hypothetical protein AB0J83_30880 [Actinoplanes sp. NPDC049596]|uniref:hypothetical protein n=1 Tax=unclassified Actinoplanes TaxID=2626549 RepID=UPI0034128B93
MLAHTDLMLDLAHNQQRELIAEADKWRVLRSAREARRARKPRGRPDGSLASCEPSAVVPAR